MLQHLKIDHILTEATPGADLYEALTEGLKIAVNEGRDVIVKHQDKLMRISITSILAKITTDNL